MKLNRCLKVHAVTAVTLALAVLTSGTVVAKVDAPDLFYQTFNPADGQTGRSVTLNIEVNPTTLSLEYVGLRSQLLREGAERLRIALPTGQTVVASLTNKHALDKKSTIWHGLIDVEEGKVTKAMGLEDNATFVVTGDRVTGQINYRGQTFELLTVEEGGHYLLVERDFSQQQEEGDDTPLIANPIYMQELLDEDVKEPRAARAKTIIRVLQIASREAQIELGGINSARDRMRLFLAQANNVYLRNGIPVQLQNAGLHTPPGKQETIFAELLIDSFSDPNDGLLYDTLAGGPFYGIGRNGTRADIVGLMTSEVLIGLGDFLPLCGIADAVGATQSQAFFLISHRCLDSYSFVHEIGHLFGAHHDKNPRATPFPFRFGHGFVNARRNFRTVMAVNDPLSPPRVGVFSNIDQLTHGGVSGTANLYNNKRVHMIRRNAVSRFR